MKTLVFLCKYKMTVNCNKVLYNITAVESFSDSNYINIIHK